MAAAVVGDMGDSSAVRKAAAAAEAEGRAGVEGGICKGAGEALPTPAKGLATPVLVVNPPPPEAAPTADAAAGGMSIAGGAGGTAAAPVRLGVTTSGDDSALGWLLDDDRAEA